MIISPRIATATDQAAPSPARCGGNVLFIILIAVALFGALSAAVTRSTGTVSPETLTQGQAQIYASEIIQYGIDLEQAVNRLLTLKGCEETQISFDYDIPNVTGYENANAPSDYHCHVFHVNGGGVAYKPMNPEWLDGKTTHTLYGNIHFLTTCVEAAGPPYVGNCNTGAPTVSQQYADLIVIVPFIKEEICLAIAEKIMGSSTIPVDSYNGFHNVKFVGNFGAATAHIDFNAPHEHLNQGTTAGCFTGDGGGGADMMAPGRYTFYNTLLAR